MGDSIASHIRDFSFYSGWLHYAMLCLFSSQISLAERASWERPSAYLRIISAAYRISSGFSSASIGRFPARPVLLKIFLQIPKSVLLFSIPAVIY